MRALGRSSSLEDRWKTHRTHPILHRLVVQLVSSLSGGGNAMLKAIEIHFTTPKYAGLVPAVAVVLEACLGSFARGAKASTCASAHHATHAR